MFLTDRSADSENNNKKKRNNNKNQKNQQTNIQKIPKPALIIMVRYLCKLVNSYGKISFTKKKLLESFYLDKHICE